MELSGDDHLPFFGDQDSVVALAQEFLTGATPAVQPDRVLIEHQEAVRRHLTRFRGREVKTTGDGFLATFDGPARAIRAADAIRAGLAELALAVRVGLHTGECELLGEDIGGIAVNFAAPGDGRRRGGGDRLLADGQGPGRRGRVRLRRPRCPSAQGRPRLLAAVCRRACRRPARRLRDRCAGR